MLLAIFAVVGALITPQPRTQPNSQPQPTARSSQVPSSAKKPLTPSGATTPPPLCQTPGEVAPDGSVCDCPWGVGPEGQCLCPPESPSPQPAPCTGALRPPLPEPAGVLNARNNSHQWHSKGAISKAGPIALWRSPRGQRLTDRPGEIWRIALPPVSGQRT